jgi:hypothetical protein
MFLALPLALACTARGPTKRGARLCHLTILHCTGQRGRQRTTILLMRRSNARALTRTRLLFIAARRKKGGPSSRRWGSGPMGPMARPSFGWPCWTGTAVTLTRSCGPHSPSRERGEEALTRPFGPPSPGGRGVYLLLITNIARSAFRFGSPLTSRRVSVLRATSLCTDAPISWQ